MSSTVSSPPPPPAIEIMVINSVSSKTLYNTFPKHDLALSEMYLIEFIIFYNVINMIHSEIKEN